MDKVELGPEVNRKVPELHMRRYMAFDSEYLGKVCTSLGQVAFTATVVCPYSPVKNFRCNFEKYFFRSKNDIAVEMLAFVLIFIFYLCLFLVPFMNRLGTNAPIVVLAGSVVQTA